MRNDELMHYGIKGMKWGIRRFQPYPKGFGKGRYTGAAAKKNKNRSSVDMDSLLKPSIKGGKDKPQMSPLEKALKDAKTTTNEAGRAVDSYSRIKRRVNAKKRPEELSKISDKELRDRINRMILERQYVQLTDSNVSTGSDYVKDILDITGDLLAVGASAASIASAIYMIRKRK